jgi:hypothetical protein
MEVYFHYRRKIEGLQDLLIHTSYTKVELIVILSKKSMTELRKFTLEYNEKKGRWDLENDKTNKVIKTFKTKEVATTGGVLKKVLGEDGGSVKIQKENGRIQEERTYPRSADPVESKG